MLAVGAPEAGGEEHAPCNPATAALHAPHVPIYSDFFFWHVGWDPRVCWCMYEMGISSGCGTLTVTFYVPLSWRVYSARRESCLR